jgi:hypothetical protein
MVLIFRDTTDLLIIYYFDFVNILIIIILKMKLSLEKLRHIEPSYKTVVSLNLDN